ncbi:DUF1127 domain-containing protein [Sinorhizobium meliloti]|nr:DUF1127 domain-containing protein [Sinorhizobium meliloti]WKL27347.1 DUF1127 domain-containing protein [Sinorhizobium meliloti]WKL32929.1 DUF1127 domain-containing protein [Sinorhizobium meliloti]WKL38697.1 DUF1127 domain-containing protein [Sinorhizobium meliloti]WKL42222.1 DUF1127 domain-containing protein [Sinorhizobium meliloti]
MNDIPSVVTETPRRPYRPATIRSIIVTWDERKRFRCELEQKLKDDPHLISDIGLTKLEAEAEIAKPFWQV